ncbi:hypothetical protein HanRHA438_Chr02g0080451 [Helianthus annuus]|nr:hypothetical protein HanRHA438_Chr02g0080451 [Helianthus annuus]
MVPVLPLAPPHHHRPPTLPPLRPPPSRPPRRSCAGCDGPNRWVTPPPPPATPVLPRRPIRLPSVAGLPSVTIPTCDNSYFEPISVIYVTYVNDM